MYIQNDGYTYYKGTSQCRSRGDFLILIQPEGWEHRDAPLKALVRKVAMQQLGHFMMGFARVYGQRLTLSGAYGSDGLPTSVPREIYDRAQVLLPRELYDAWASGGGWNSVGSEAPLMREWALKNLRELKK